VKDAACASCGARFGQDLIDRCERSEERGFNCFRFTCGGCMEKLIASMDHVGRLGVTKDVSGISGEFPVMEPEATG
jgi:hypothetical protein